MSRQVMGMQARRRREIKGSVQWQASQGDQSLLRYQVEVEINYDEIKG